MGYNPFEPKSDFIDFTLPNKDTNYTLHEHQILVGWEGGEEACGHPNLISPLFSAVLSQVFPVCHRTKGVGSQHK